MAQTFSVDSISEYEDTIKGRFGWITFKGHHILYIIRKRNGEDLKFVSVRIAETHLLKSHLHYLNPEMYKCLSVKCHYITKSEAKLLTNINKNDCKYAYGHQDFIFGKDCIVRLEDALDFYKFLEVCYNKIHLNIDDHEIQFGYFRFDCNTAPFFIKDNKKYVSLLFFEGALDKVLLQTVELKNWDLVYYKLCCKIMGVCEHFYDVDSCTVINFDCLSIYLASGTSFHEFWPANLSRHSFITNQTGKDNQTGAWTTHYTEVISAPKNTIPNTLTTPEILQSVPVTMNARHNDLTNQSSSSVMPQESSSTNQNILSFSPQLIYLDSALRASSSINNIECVPSTSSQAQQQQRQQQQGQQQQGQQQQGQQQQDQQVIFLTPQQLRNIRAGTARIIKRRKRAPRPVDEKYIIDLTKDP